MVDEERNEQPFSAVLKAASWDDHRRAENAPFMRMLLSGTSDRAGFAALLAQNYFAYQALERAATVMSDDPIAGAFVFPALHRVDRLEADLRDLIGDDWRSRVEPSAPTTAYVARLDEVGSTWPGGFVAHHYVRYLGDLSGGQLIRRIVQRHYGLQTGTSSYVFDGVGNLVEFKNRYRRLLDMAPWDAHERRAIVDEVVLAFRLNADVLDALPGEPELSFR